MKSPFQIAKKFKDPRARNLNMITPKTIGKSASVPFKILFFFILEKRKKYFQKLTEIFQNRFDEIRNILQTEKIKSTNFTTVN